MRQQWDSKSRIMSERPQSEWKIMLLRMQNALLGDKFVLGARKACLSIPQLLSSSLCLSFKGHEHGFCCSIIRWFSHLELLKDPRFVLKIFGLFILLLLKVIGYKASAYYPLGVPQWVLGPISFEWVSWDTTNIWPIQRSISVLKML